MRSFFWREIAGCFWATGVFRQYCSFKVEKKTSNIYKWKEKVQKNTGRRRKVQVTTQSSLQRTSSLCFLHGGELPLAVLKHNRVSEVFKGFKVHDFEYYGQRKYILKWKFNLYH